MQIQFRDGARGQNLELLVYIPNAAGPPGRTELRVRR